jgi:transposase-like protein
MSTRDIVQVFDERYGADISPTVVSRVTNAVLEQVTCSMTELVTLKIRLADTLAS